MREWTPTKKAAYDEIAKAMEAAPPEVVQTVFAAVDEQLFSFRASSLI